MGQYLLGIDNGSTVSKAALFDLHGKEIAVASCKADTEYPHPGWTERDMEMLWQSTASAIREVTRQIGGQARRRSPELATLDMAMASICWTNKDNRFETAFSPWTRAQQMW